MVYFTGSTAKANGLEPYHYLPTVFALQPHATTVDDIERLLPWNINPNTLAREQTWPLQTEHEYKWDLRAQSSA